jgi:hypothetical protein
MLRPSVTFRVNEVNRQEHQMQIASTSKEAFLESLVHLTTERVEVDVQEMAEALKSVPTENFAASEWQSVVEFSIGQLAVWRAQWLFSSAGAPNAMARDQSARWDATTDVFISSLAQQIPAVGEPLQRKKNLLVVEYLIRQKLQRDGNGAVPRFKSWALSTLARIMYRIGFSSIAQGLQTRALFPPGTMGRIGA